MVIYNYKNEHFTVDNNLAFLLGISNQLIYATIAKTLDSPSTYFIYCNLIHKK